MRQQFSFMRQRGPLETEQLKRLVPSAFAEAPAEQVSSKYEFIPTTRVISILDQQGWTPVQANQSRSKSEEGRDFVKHLIRFQNQSVSKVGNDIPELVLTNSHNGTSAFQLFLGIYRLVCSNGLMIGETIQEHRIRHVGFKAAQVIEASYSIIESVPKLAASVSEFKQVQLNRDEQQAFAETALTLKYSAEDKAPIDAEKLLLTRRAEDRETQDLWTTFNVVQENLIRGGLRYVNRDENGRARRNSTREVKSVNENVRLNKALWTLAEKMKALKVG